MMQKLAQKDHSIGISIRLTHILTDTFQHGSIRLQSSPLAFLVYNQDQSLRPKDQIRHHLHHISSFDASVAVHLKSIHPEIMDITLVGSYYPTRQLDTKLKVINHQLKFHCYLRFTIIQIYICLLSPFLPKIGVIDINIVLVVRRYKTCLLKMKVLLKGIS